MLSEFKASDKSTVIKLKLAINEKIYNNNLPIVEWKLVFYHLVEEVHQVIGLSLIDISASHSTEWVDCLKDLNCFLW